MVNFTQEERKVIVFLCLAASLGVGIDFLGKHFVRIRTVFSPTPEICKIDLNTAEAAQLNKVPGIGEKSAQRIIDYRKKHLRYFSISELCNISGISDKKLETLKKYLTVE